MYAVDAQEKMLEMLQEKLGFAGVSNVELVHAEADLTPLSGATCDLVFLANVWHELDDRQSVLRDAKRILKNLGRVGILDWRPDVEPEHGPPLEYRLTPESVRAELILGGFEQIAVRNIGKYSWLVQGTAASRGCKDCDHSTLSCSRSADGGRERRTLHARARSG